MEVYWLEQTEAEMPAENDWLSKGEMVRLDGMRFAKRRADWRLGRWTAKCAVAAYLDLPGDRPSLTDIEIRPASSGAPEVFVGNKPAAVSISLSHRSGIAACAVAPSGAALGCDLEMIEPLSDAFVADYFTGEEQALVALAPAADRFRIVALVWSGKESALKALHEGLRLATHSVTVSALDTPGNLGGDGKSWRPLQVRCADGQVFQGWWQRTGSLLRTLVASPPPVPPIPLELPTYFSAKASSF